MRGSDLQRLASVAKAARGDFAQAPISLYTQDGFLVADYTGGYSCGRVMVPSDGGKGLAVSVQASDFASYANTVPPASTDVRMVYNPKDNIMILSQGQVKGTKLRVFGTDVQPNNYEVKSAEYSATVGRESFKKEIEIASEFASKTMQRPILTGIHLTFTRNEIGIEATDGNFVLYRSRYGCDTTITGDEEPSIIVPVEDFLFGLDVADVDVTILKPAGLGRVQITSRSSDYYLALLSGSWPTLPAFPATERSISIVSDELQRSAQLASNVFGAKNVILTGKGDMVTLRTEETDRGSDASLIPGTLDGSYVYPAEILGRLARLGDVILFRLPGPGERHSVASVEKREVLVYSQRF